MVLQKLSCNKRYDKRILVSWNVHNKYKYIVSVRRKESCVIFGDESNRIFRFDYKVACIFEIIIIIIIILFSLFNNYLNDITKMIYQLEMRLERKTKQKVKYIYIFLHFLLF